MCLAFGLYCLALHYFHLFEEPKNKKQKTDFYQIGVKKHTHVTQYQTGLATGHGKA